MKAELVPENGDPPIPLVRDITIIGRHADCDVVINSPGLSKRHCVLVKTDGLLVIRDLATTNGTKVKGQKIRWAALLPDDKLSFGGYKVRIYLGSDEMPSPSEIRERRAAENQRSGLGSRPPSVPKGQPSPAAATTIVGPNSLPPPRPLAVASGSRDSAPAELDPEADLRPTVYDPFGEPETHAEVVMRLLDDEDDDIVELS
jgi:hypothetical protein